MKSGAFVTFEGGEGCGKSTQIARLGEALSTIGVETLLLREPGGTRLGELVRDTLLDPAHVEMSARAELLLYEASRAQLVAERIVPALERGTVVVCDRFYDSTTAYQGYGRGLPLDEVHALNAAATGGLVPDLTILLDLAPERGLERATAGGADRLESQDAAFHERVREGFLAIAAADSDRIAVVDADGTPDEVWERVESVVRSQPRIAAALDSQS